MLGGDLRSLIHREQRPVVLENLDSEQYERTVNGLIGTIHVPTLSLGNSGEGFATRPDWLGAVGRMPEPASSIWRSVGSVQRSSTDSFRSDYAAARTNWQG